MTATTEALVRQQRLATRVRGLRVRRGLGDRWLLVGGSILVPLGVLLVLLGWAGASRTVLVFEQLPYLISGGLLGLALVVAGGFLYFAHWLSVLVREARSERTQLVAVLERMERLLEDGATRPVRTTGSAPVTGLVATRTGTMLHRPDCVAVDGRDNLRAVDAGTPGMAPCRLCDPLGDA